jgi:hypothetical protein
VLKGKLVVNGNRFVTISTDSNCCIVCCIIFICKTIWISCVSPVLCGNLEILCMTKKVFFYSSEIHN